MEAIEARLARRTEMKSIALFRIPKNQLQEVPVDEIEQMSNLRWLDMAENLILVMPESLCSHLHQLRVLSLAWNRLTTISASLFIMPSLQSLNLIGNSISVIPAIKSSNNDLRLRTLHLANNQICDYPDLQMFSNLETLSLAKNPKLGPFSRSVSTDAKEAKSLILEISKARLIRQSALCFVFCFQCCDDDSPLAVLNKDVVNLIAKEIFSHRF